MTVPSPDAMSPCNLLDLMSWPFFSLAKSPRQTPVDFHMGRVAVHVTAGDDSPIATIWDADVLIWAVSTLVAARNRGEATSVHVGASLRDILLFLGRGESAEKYDRLRAALDRLRATRVTTSLRHPGGGLHGFTWLTAWQERHGAVDLILPDWLHDGAAGRSVLTIDRAYFGLMGGLERWLYLLVRRHAGYQRTGWRFDLRHLYEKSSALSSYPRFAFEIRRLVQTQSLPGYRLHLIRSGTGDPILGFEPTTGGQGYPRRYVHNAAFPVDNAGDNA